MKKILICVGIVGLLIVLLFGSLYFLGKNLAGGGGSEQYAPDTVGTGEPAVVKFYVSAWGGGGPIKGRYTGISLHYKLVGENTYKAVQPQPVALPDNYQKVVSKTNQWEAYEFLIPPYPKGTTGEIEYYIDLTFDGYPSRQDGIKKIKLTEQSLMPKTINWKTYRNEKYRFEIKYPPTLEPLEGQALFYRPPEFSPLLNVCFASVNRREFYCEAELYIAPSFVASPQNLKFSNADSFLGQGRCIVEIPPPHPKFDSIQGIRVDTCGGESTRLNTFVTKDDFLYLISTEPGAGYTTGKDATFEEMVNSFNFINL